MHEYFSKCEPIYTISTAAKLLGISVHTLRMYEREGLIIPFKKNSNQRLYSNSDIERITCVRNAISKSKISINGIKAIYSMIPCSKLVNCSDEEKDNCKAFIQNDQACWSFKEQNSFCRDEDCIDCKVYKNYSACSNIKELLNKMKRDK